jgi:hypothetical protein
MMHRQESRERLRRQVLSDAGASAEVIAELLSYNANPFDLSRHHALALPLDDEAHIAAWEEYERDASAVGVFPALAERLVQLRFPVAPGISESADYRAATRRGVRPPGPPRLAIEQPDRLSLVLHRSAAGRVPVVTVGNRRDFVTLVRACSARNEPEPVPDSMGACIVVGLNNWDRVFRYRRELEVERGGPLTDADWAAAFQALVPRKALYQDRFIILSRTPYSAVPAADVGLPEEEWLEKSVAVRLEHECTHYFTLRAFGAMRNNLLDEFIADAAGLAHAFGRYDAALFLRFLGLEAYPAFRPGGRLELYLGTPPLTDSAVPVLRHLIVLAARQLEAFTAGLQLGTEEGRFTLVLALAGLTLEELASGEANSVLASAAAAAGNRARLDASRTIG